MASLPEIVAAHSVRLDNVEADVVDIRNQIGHAGQPDTIRGRLHVVENFNAAAQAADAAMSAARSAQAALASAKERRTALTIAAANVLVVGLGVIADVLLR